MRRLLFLLPFLAMCGLAAAQGTGVLVGQVRDERGQSLPFVNVVLVEEMRGITANEQGAYVLQVPAGKPVVVRFSFTGMLPRTDTLEVGPGERREWNVILRSRTLSQVEIEGMRRQAVGLETLDPKVTRFIPRPMDGVEALLVGQMGFTQRSELSSGYSVRGGNFDENLVYVNDIEVYRPFLVRAGQQEGLSFPNPDMIERIQFSAGGFEARYGDKLSSVLDIAYKRPKGFAGSASASLLGGSVHLENTMAGTRLRQITGFRYRRNQYLLDGLDTQGEYDPVYSDLQTYWTYDLTEKVELGFLGVFSSNRYNLIPQSRETELGSFNQALRFTVFFEGQERTAFDTYFGAVNLNVQQSKDLLLKFTASAYRTFESERFTILGQYRLSELERDLGSDQFGEVVRDLGVGSYLDHARNDLDATVLTVAHRGFLQLPRSYLQWGGDLRSEIINDRLNEWTMIDSADYSIPQSGPDALELRYSLKSKLNLQSIRATAYVQNAWSWQPREYRRWDLVAGLRAHYWSYNGQTVVSPRMRVTYRPGWTTLDANGDTVLKDFSFWFATGLYYQPPFYRELRRFDGTLGEDVRAQRSVHFLLGMDRHFKIWDRPFKFATEAYYKYMDDVIPYKVDNVRIRYFGENSARGRAIGLDMKLNGEFIPGIESWASIGVMSVSEDILDDFYVDRYNTAGQLIVPGFTFDQVAVDSVRREPGSIPKPTDQRVNVAFFFQDEMPNWPTFKVHVSLVFGTGLPFGPPSPVRYSDTLRTNLYRRVDIGFSKQLLGAAGQEKTGFLGHINNMWLSLEVFNLLNINNTIDYSWVQDVNSRYYAIPGFLTPRRLNLKLIAWF